MTFTKEQLIEQATKNIAVLRGAVERIPGASDAAVIHLKLAEITLSALAGVEAERGCNPVLAYADSYRGMAKQGVESISVWGVITDLERNIAPHFIAPQPLTTSERAELENYRNAQQVVPSDGRDQFEEWFKFHHGDEHSIAMLQRANGGANYIDPYVDLAWISWKDSRAAMLQAGNSPVIPDGCCIMPMKLTAENGAKGALSGEFHVTHHIVCQSCGGEGCEDCNEEGGWDGEILIGWDIIKQIHDAAVKACSLPAAPQQEV